MNDLIFTYNIGIPSSFYFLSPYHKTLAQLEVTQMDRCCKLHSSNMAFLFRNILVGDGYLEYNQADTKNSNLPIRNFKESMLKLCYAY